MARVEIENLPVEQNLTCDEQKQLAGGYLKFDVIKIDGIDGASKDAAHGKEIEVLSFSWGRTNVSLNY